MSIKFVFLWTDILLYLLLLAGGIFLIYVKSNQQLKQAYLSILYKPKAMVALTVLGFFLLITVLDSIHFRYKLQSSTNESSIHYAAKVTSVLDIALSAINKNYEKTYSAPFARELYTKEMVLGNDGKYSQIKLPLEFAAIGVNSTSDYIKDLSKRFVLGVLAGLLIFLIVKFLFKKFITNTKISTRAFFVTSFSIIMLFSICFSLMQNYHILGTDKVGNDVFYECIKSIRTGILIGTLTTLIMLPFAIFLGTVAGFFGGIIDDLIGYTYTTLSSIPGVLLIAAAILSLQVIINQNEQLFPTPEQKADIKLLALCAILGITSWTNLCRLLRAETLKLKSIDFINAARAFGVGKIKIIGNHILPNVMHIIIISIILDFSGLVLAEAVLSYVGVGVDPSSYSWGNMINGARMEMAREPIIWWSLFGAFFFMFSLVLAANVFADCVRDALDPRA